MMAGETIDSLSVDIGLTTQEFQAGIQRVLDSMGRMQTAATETGSSMSESFAAAGASIGGLVLKFAGLFLAVRGIEDVVGYFKDLHVELANLGFASEYLGQSGVALSRFGEVARLAGGNAQDAISAVQSLQASIFGLEFQGQMSQNLLMLQRLGVGYLDTAGHMRDIKDIAFETAQKLQGQLPGKANEALRVQWAAQIFGAGGLANAVGGGLAQLRTFYDKAAKDQKDITQKAINQQEQLSRDLTSLSYAIKSEATRALDKLTPEIDKLIGVIRDQLIPTIDELISDVMDWLHPQKMVDKALGGKGVGPLGLNHPINTFEAIGIGLGIRFHQLMESFKGFEVRQELGTIQIPAQVMPRLTPGTDLDALRILHGAAGGDKGDPTWSKAIIAYGDLAQYPGGPEGYVNDAITMAHRAVSPHTLSTPSAPRPAAHAPGAILKPIAGLTGPRVQIGSIGPIYTQATDANGLMADINRAAQRKLLVAQADPGLA
jgi:hypothetical protein